MTTEQIIEQMIEHINQNLGNKITPALGTGLINILAALLDKKEPIDG